MINPLSILPLVYLLFFALFIGGIGYCIWYIYHLGICGIPVLGDMYATFATCSRPADTTSKSAVNSMQGAADQAITKGYGPTGCLPWAQSQGQAGAGFFCNLGFGGLMGYFFFPLGTKLPSNCGVKATGNQPDFKYVIGQGANWSPSSTSTTSTTTTTSPIKMATPTGDITDIQLNVGARCQTGFIPVKSGTVYSNIDQTTDYNTYSPCIKQVPTGTASLGVTDFSLTSTTCPTGWTQVSPIAINYGGSGGSSGTPAGAYLCKHVESGKPLLQSLQLVPKSQSANMPSTATMIAWPTPPDVGTYDYNSFWKSGGSSSIINTLETEAKSLWSTHRWYFIGGIIGAMLLILFLFVIFTKILKPSASSGPSPTLGGIVIPL
jgi:hypothetical protein